MSKYVNLVAFIDGTGNNDFKLPEESQTNVARLWHACEGMQSEDVEQRVIYKAGVGTRRHEGIGGNAAGAYLCDRVTELESWLHNEIKIAREDSKVPRIYIFGFSRGAYAARWLANELGEDVEFVGVWDTVKTTLKGPDVEVASSRIKHIYHAIAIDEHRKLFDVTRFKNSPQAIEVWFPGCHSDVGGGYKEADLAAAPLNWIATHAINFGLLVDQAKIPKGPCFSMLPVIHDEAKKFGWRFVNFFAGDKYYDRTISIGDNVHYTVAQLGEFDYAPSFMPHNCVVWDDRVASQNANIA